MSTTLEGTLVVQDPRTIPLAHEIYPLPSKIPYKHLTYLGHGSGGTVDKVQHVTTSTVYARKRIAMPKINADRSHLSARYLDDASKKVQKIKEEARIIRRLKHPHIVRVIFTYESPNDEDRPNFCLLLLPVAKEDLSVVLTEFDNMNAGPMKDKTIVMMRHWAGCLVRAMDYMHVMNVKHKDIKPANILVENGVVYITDFGIAKEIEVGATTGSSDMAGTRTFCSPETELRDRRGRSSDVFSMGCVFLEMATVMITEGGLGRLKDIRRGSPYSQSMDQVLRWIFYLTSSLVARIRAGRTEQEDVVLRHAAMLPGLVFVMLDPNPHSRATARQLVALICKFGPSLFCETCAEGATNDPIIPLHSVFKDGTQISYPADPEDALMESVAEDWEGAKKKWLEHHVWW
jgi:serine/threonine protein kinase